MDRELKQNKLRQKLDELAQGSPQDFVQKLPKGIILVEQPFPGVSCEQYALGTSGFRHSIPALYPELDLLMTGDLALYYDGEDVTHVGVIQEDDLVVSKWGNNGPVLMHPVDKVPASYGYYVYFRRIPENELKEINGKSIFDLIT